MIVTVRVEDSVDLVKTYSDTGMMIIQDGTGDMYSEAIDPDYMNRTYTESDIPINKNDDEIPYEYNANELLNIILGREE